MSDQTIRNQTSLSTGRIFTRTDLARTGLNSGDVVALRVKGAFLASVPLDHQETPLLYMLAPLHDATLDDDSVLLEVVRHGEWVGFKSWVANNSLLQAKKKGAHRLVFYSTRFGIYEQWSSLDIHALDSIHWKSTVMTLQNRKVHTCEMRVEVFRVGCVREAGDVQHGKLFPRSLEDTESMKCISGMMVQEWIKFVEKEKERRSLLEARVEKAIENVDGLKKWASEQVQCARRDVQEEIELLIDALQDRNAALADVSARLTTRIQWGAALLEAKKATILGRRVLLAWKTRATRSKYCDAVVLKLRRRSQMKSALIALDAWMALVQKSKDLQQRLRLGVRRMSSLKMNSAFSKWREYSYESHKNARIEACIHHDALLIAQSQMAKRVLNSWRLRTNRSNEARRLLSFCESRHNESLVSRIFGSWKAHKVETGLALKALRHRIVLREKMQLLFGALHTWRLSVDDGLGERIELDRSISVHVRKTKHKVFDVWKSAVSHKKHAQRVVSLMELSQQRDTKAQCITHWQQYTLEAAERRGNLMSFVLSISRKTSLMTFQFWKEYALYKKQTKLHISNALNKRNTLSLLDCLSWWRAFSQEEKVHRKLLNMFSQRRDMKTTKISFGSWRAQCQKSTRTYINLVNFTNAWSAKRMKVSFSILRQHAEESILDQGIHKKAVVWHSQKLYARAFAALEIGAQRHNTVLKCLSKIRSEHERQLKKWIWDAWTYQTDETIGRKAICHNYSYRKQWHTKNQFFIAWRNFTAEEIFWDSSATARKRHIDVKRTGWLFQIWREITASETTDSVLNRKADLWHARKISTKTVQAWTQQNNNMRKVKLACDLKSMEKERILLSTTLFSWRRTWLYNEHLRLSGQKVMDSYGRRLQSLALSAWRQKTDISRANESIRKRALLRISHLILKNSFFCWRQIMEDESGKAAYCLHMENHIARKKGRRILSEAFAGWRLRCIQIKSYLHHTEDRRSNRLHMLISMSFCSWKFNAKMFALRRIQMLELLARKQTMRTALESFLMWRHEARRQSRNGIVVLHSVERIVHKLLKQSLSAWRMSAAERKDQRTTMVHLLNNYFLRRMKCVFISWKIHAAEESRKRKSLERCVLQKKMAWDLFRHSYWETVDDQMHETLEAMFADAPDEPCLGQAEKYDSKELLSNNTGYLSRATVQEESPPSSYFGSLRDMSSAFESKGKDLSAKVCRALEQINQSPGHALTPPKHELNVLEPLQYFFTRNKTHGSISGAESISMSDFSTSDPEEIFEEGTEIIDIGNFTPRSAMTDDLSDYSSLQTSNKHGTYRKPLTLGKSDIGTYSPPGSPLILARDVSH